MHRIMWYFVDRNRDEGFAGCSMFVVCVLSMLVAYLCGLSGTDLITTAWSGMIGWVAILVLILKLGPPKEYCRCDPKTDSCGMTTINCPSCGSRQLVIREYDGRRLIPGHITPDNDVCTARWFGSPDKE